MVTNSVTVINISKSYQLYHEKPTLIENILGKKKVENFWALKNINMRLKRGERVGLIGPNGSGKTTLLKIIAGITKPTKGSVNLKGKIVSLIELYAGFQPDLTGEENIYMNGLLIGMEKREIEEKFDAIVNFADVGKFIDAPFYTYSSGMALRIGFSVALHSEPDILVCDENHAVGDQNFRNKIEKQFSKLIAKDCTIIMATHDLNYLSRHCTRLIWLEGGKVKMAGETKKLLRSYYIAESKQKKVLRNNIFRK